MTIYDDANWFWNTESLRWEHNDLPQTIRFDSKSAKWEVACRHWSGTYYSLDLAYVLASEAEAIYRDGHDDGYEEGWENGYDEGRYEAREECVKPPADS